MHPQLRLAEEADTPALHQLDELARGGHSDRSALIDEAVASRRCLVAQADKLVGYLLMQPRRFFERDFVELLIVHDAHRRRGVGRALLEAAVAQAGTSRVFSSTNESNGAMRALFTTLGWTLSGRLDGLDPGDPEIVYFIDRPLHSTAS